MLADVVDLLQCPHCAGSLSLMAGTVACRTGHRFDVARQGQLNLLRGAAGVNADTAAMVADRVAFLARGHYAPIAELVAQTAHGSVAVEAGAGTAYYLAAAVTSLRDAGTRARGLATDISAYACRRAAKVPHVGAIVADTWAGLPIRDGVADTVLAVFAPRNLSEFARICAPDGRVLVVTPLPDHLQEVRRSYGLMAIEDSKATRLLRDAESWLTHDGHQELRYSVDLSPTDLRHLIGMGPNAFHAATRAPDQASTDEPLMDESLTDEPLTTTVAVRLDRFHPRSVITNT